MTNASTESVRGSLLLSLSREATLLAGTNGDLIIQTGRGRITLRHLTAGACQAINRLSNGGATEQELEGIVVQSDGSEGLASFYYQVQQLSRRSLLWRSAEDEHGRRLATLVPVSPHFKYPGFIVNRDQAYALSRFSFTRVEAGRTVVESPLAYARLVLYDWRAAALLQALALPTRVLEVVDSVPDLSTDAARNLMSLLLNAAMIGESDDSGVPAADRLPSLQSWEFHDLLFHTRSREGRHDLPIGGTCRFAGKLEPPPSFKPVSGCEFIELHRPDLEQLRRADPTFAQVIEQRRSIREYDQNPITLEQLGEFLFRVARAEDLRQVKVETPVGPVGMEFTSRPYPAGGALYELEVYLGVNACAGLTSGLYHYDPRPHRLGRLAGRTAQLDSLFNGAGAATGIRAENLQVLLILTARFQRLAWKYAAIAYALSLKHVGVLYQTMYLTATAMNLASCAVGCGDADVFARAAGTDYYSETSIGEFLLGSSKKPNFKSASIEVCEQQS